MTKPVQTRKPKGKQPRRTTVDKKKIAAAIAKLDEIKPPNAKVAGVIALFKSWLEDESGYDEETWPKLKKALNRERGRVGARRLFHLRSLNQQAIPDFFVTASAPLSASPGRQ
jgi:hypothetical protein